MARSSAPAGIFATHNPSPPVSVTLYPSGVADFGFQLVPTAYAPYVATIDLARGGDIVNDVPYTGNEFVGYVGPAVTSVTVASQGFVNLTDFVAPAVVPEPATWAMALIGSWSVAVAMRASRQRAFRSGA